ncbi:MAG: Card1-like endonuclease domain-containing protein [Sulfuricaulis sp.]
MTKATAHVLLVSAQAAPNLLPALDREMKPDEAILLVSAKMQARADALEKVLMQAGVRTGRIALANEHDFAALESTLFDVAASRDGQAVALNVTGGTKLMALAAQSIAQAAGWSVFYVDADTDEVIWLGKNATLRHKLTEQLKLRHYLMGYGFEMDSGAELPRFGQLCHDLIETLLSQISSLEQPLGQLNWLAQQAEDKNTLSVILTPQQQDSRSLEALLRNFKEAGVLQVTDDHVIFPDENRRGFAKGGWLEHYVFRVVGGLSHELGIRDKHANLKVTDANDVKNELDIAFMARNRLFVIECKTARMDQELHPKANDTLFKLAEVCRRVGGLGTRGLLASYRPLRDAEKRLARALGIELICGADLARLDEKLKRWVWA